MQGTQIDNSAIDKSSKTRRFYMPTLMEEIKPKLVLLVKNEIKYREKLKMFSLEVSNYQDSDAKERNNDFFNRIPVYKCFVFEWKFDGGNRTSGGWELEVWNSSETKLNSTFSKIWTVTNLLPASNEKICYFNCPPQTESFRWRLWLKKS